MASFNKMVEVLRYNQGGDDGMGGGKCGRMGSIARFMQAAHKRAMTKRRAL